MNGGGRQRNRQQKKGKEKYRNRGTNILVVQRWLLSILPPLGVRGEEEETN